MKLIPERNPKTGMFEYRQRIPTRLEKFAGKKHHHKSLSTKDKAEAVGRWAEEHVRHQADLKQWREWDTAGLQGPPARHEGALELTVSTIFDATAVDEAIEQWRLAEIGRAFIEVYNGLVDVNPLSDDAVHLSDRLVRLKKWRGYENVPDFDDQLRTALRSQGIEVPPDHPMLRRQRPLFCAALVDALEYRYRMIRDPLSVEPPHVTPPRSVPCVSTGPKPIEIGLSLRELVEKYLATPTPRGRRDRTAVDRLKNGAEYLTNFIGDDRPVDQITRAQVSNFWLECLKLPKHRRKDEIGKTFRELTAVHREQERCITQHTVAGLSRVMSACTRWGLTRGHIFGDPFRDNSPAVPERRNTEVTAFEPEHLTILFTCDVFDGKAPSPAWYWIPLICLFSGARVNEIGQLHADDVIWGDVPYFDIDHRVKDSNNPRKAQAKKSLKTERFRSPCIRWIPIHPILLALGFRDFFDAYAGDFVFEDLPHGGERKPTHKFSKDAGKLLDRLGINDPRYRLHSFRHSFDAAIDRCDLHEGRAKFIMGHRTVSKAQENYRKPPELSNLFREISKVTFPGFPEVKPWTRALISGG